MKIIRPKKLTFGEIKAGRFWSHTGLEAIKLKTSHNGENGLITGYFVATGENGYFTDNSGVTLEPPGETKIGLTFGDVEIGDVFEAIDGTILRCVESDDEINEPVAFTEPAGCRVNIQVRDPIKAIYPNHALVLDYKEKE